MRRDAEVFADALALAPDERGAFLQRVCADEPAQRTRIEKLITAHEEASAFMREPAATRAAELPEERPGDAIGRYKLLQKLGEGGCGIVYMAEQEEPVRRRVALKVIKLGMDTKEVIARFEAERQAVAMMDHANIAKVFDAGATETGRPFFVMELVRGIKITDYCDQSNLTTAERLQLFAQVCRAIQHAHQKGIIHRDIKPSNILVTLHDGVAVPKVIDFGIAKATQGRLTDSTVFTAFEQFIGTPAYMSPEQAEMSGLDIDTRSDIYSLGVLLYELLTGRTPFDGKELMQAGLDAMRRQIREVDPPKPSTRLSTMGGDAITATAKLRQTEPPKLLSLIRGDLDWIVMRCLEKDRTRRYETANGLAVDLIKHLQHEPVSACPPSAVYLLRKFARRHRVGFAAGAMVAATIVIGAGVATWQAVRATRAEKQAEAQRDVANAARVAETKAREVAEQRRTEAETAQKAEAEARAVAERRRIEVETINRLVLSDALDAADPEVAQGREMTVREVLDNAAARIGGAFADNPLLEAAIRQTIGAIYLKLSRREPAAAHLEAAAEIRRRELGADHPETLLSRRSLGELRTWERKWDEAKQILQEVHAVQERTLGADHPDTLETFYWILDGMDHSGSAKPAEWEQLAREAYARALKQLGPEHPTTVKLLQAVQAAVSRGIGKAAPQDRAKMLAETLALSEELVAVQQRTLGPAHKWTLYAMVERGSVLSMAGRLIEMEQLYLEIIARGERAFGPAYVYVNIVRQRLAFHYQRNGRRAEAADNHLRVAAGAITALGNDGQNAVSFVRMMGDYVLELGYVDAAARFALDRLPEARRRLPADSPGLIALVYVLGAARLAQNQPAEAEALLRECHAFHLAKELNGVGRYYVENVLGGALVAQRKFAEAEPLLLSAVAGINASPDSARNSDRGRFQSRNAVTRIVQMYTDWGKPEQATEWQRKLTALSPPPAARQAPPPISEVVLARTAPRNLLFDAADGDSRNPAIPTTPPQGWHPVGDNRANYLIGLERTGTQTQPTSAYVKAIESNAPGYGGIGQTFNASEYRGKRVRLIASVKTVGVAGRAQLFVGIYRGDRLRLAFDNMQARARTGTSDWATSEIVLDVPVVAAMINFGFFVSGAGQAWIKDVRFELVGSDVATTAPSLTLAPPVPTPESHPLLFPQVRQ